MLNKWTINIFTWIASFVFMCIDVYLTTDKQAIHKNRLLLFVNVGVHSVVADLKMQSELVQVIWWYVYYLFIED